MIAFAILAGILAGLILIAAFRPTERGETHRWIVAVGAAVPGLIFVLALVNAQQSGRLGSLRITLEEARFKPAQLRAVNIGGDKATDALVIPGLDKNAIVIRQGADAVEVVARASDPDAAGRLASTTKNLKPGDSFSTRAGRGRVVIEYGRDGWVHVRPPTGETKQLFKSRLDAAFAGLPRAARGQLGVNLDGMSAQTAAAASATVMSFDVLGQPLREALTSQVVLSQGGDRFGVRGAEGLKQYRYGASFQAGSAASQAVFRLDRLDWSWSGFALLTWLPILALAVSAVATWQARRRSIIAFSILSIVDFMLMTRLLVSVEAAYVGARPTLKSPALGADVANAVPEAIVALCAAPFLVAVFAAWTKPEDRWARLGQGAFGAAAIALVAVSFGGMENTAWLLSAGVLAGLGWLVFQWRREQPPAVLVAEAPAASETPDARGLASVFTRPIILLLLLGTVRAVAASLGIKDDLGLPGIRLSTTVFYVPALLLASAWAFVPIGRALAAEKGWRLQTERALVWGVAVAFAVVVWAYIAKDTGFIFVTVWPFAFLGALAAVDPKGSASPAARTVMAAPAAILLLALALVHLWAAFQPDASPTAAALASGDPKKVDRLLENYASLDSKRLRLLRLADPSRFEATGTKSAENLRSVMGHMATYADTAFGRGYIPTEAPTELNSVQLDDNAAAVHLISPFGAFGATALIAVLLAGAAAATLAILRQAGSSALSLDARSVFGLLCLWSFVFTGVYMVLVNLQVVPFVGRNVYLLSGRSVSDLVEGLGLLTLAYFCLGQEKPA